MRSTMVWILSALVLVPALHARAQDGPPRTDGSLYTYRVAFALTDEYVEANGTAGAGAAEFALMDAIERVSDLLTTEVGIALDFVDAVWWSQENDPFTDPGVLDEALWNENQAALDGEFGAGGYDLGIVVALGSDYRMKVRRSSAAVSGVEGHAAVTLPPSRNVVHYERFLTHAIAHQFGATHTFAGAPASCGGEVRPETAVEPAGGTTVMSASRHCTTEPLATNAWLHSVSLAQIIAHRNANLGVRVDVDSEGDLEVFTGPDVTIPRGTPFRAYALGWGVLPQPLRYSWEQVDAGPWTGPTSVTGPLFEALAPAQDATRWFPDAQQVFDGVDDPHELLPEVDRTITLRFTARDDDPTGGRIASEDVVVTVSGEPFYVTSPNGGGTYRGGQVVPVTWNVGGSNVDQVRVSVFDTVSMSDLHSVVTENDGHHEFEMPCGFRASNLRFMVSSIGAPGYQGSVELYDVSDTPFTLDGEVADFTTFVAGGWEDHIVASATPDQAASEASTSPVLPGDAMAYVGFNTLNAGSGFGCGDPRVVLERNGERVFDTTTFMNANTGRAFLNVPVEVRGGRHTFEVIVDPDDLIAESDETNNRRARQFVFEPQPLEAGAHAVRPAPPLPFAGTTTFLRQAPNVDGVRIPDAEGSWMGVAISSPEIGTNYDLSLLRPSTGSDDGFTDTEVHATSNVPARYTDAVVVQQRNFGAATVDASILNENESTSHYRIEHHSTTRGPIGLGHTVPITLAEDQMLHLEELVLLEGQTGTITLVLENFDGAQSVALAIFDRDFGAGSIYDAPYIETRGSTDQVIVTAQLDEPGHYGLAIWRHAFRGTASMSFDLRTSNAQVATSVPDTPGLPAVSKVESVFPNPFNPQTTVRLAMARAGAATVQVFDPRGRRVRTLVEGRLEAGRHDLVWDGTDDAGRAVSSGVYFVRAVHRDGVDRHRISLVK